MTTTQRGLWVSCLALPLLAAPQVAAAATCTWTGLGTDDNWSTAANWDNCGGVHPTPQDGDSVVFPAGVPRGRPVNNLVGLRVGSVRVSGVPASGNGYVISGNGIVLTAGELQFSASLQFSWNEEDFTLPITLAAATVISNVGGASARVGDIDVNGFPLTFAPSSGDLTGIGTISGAGPLAKVGQLTLSLLPVNGNTFTGPMAIDGGTVRVWSRGLGSPSAGTTVAAGARLELVFATVDEPLTLAGGVLGSAGFGAGPPDIWAGSIRLTADSAIEPRSRLQISGAISGPFALTVLASPPGVGGDSTVLGANPAFTGPTIVHGELSVQGSLANSAITVATGRLSGSGTVGAVTAPGGVVSPGVAGGILTSGDLALTAAARFEAVLRSEVNFRRGCCGRASHGELRANGTVTLGGATLLLNTSGFNAPGFPFSQLPLQNSVFTIIDNDGTDPVVGTFAALPEGAEVRLGATNGIPLFISYTGGTGNDVTLTVRFPDEYFLSEGATGAFFDEDVLIANPNAVAAPVSLTYVTSAGNVVVQNRTLPARSRTTIHVDQIAGLEAAEVSTAVRSSANLPLAVERSMFWDRTSYAGHTGSATERATYQWFFAEGSQGFFQTYLLVAHTNATPVDVTITFLRETGAPIVRLVTVAPSARLTIDCGSIPEIANTSFAINVTSNQPIIAERAMYFGQSTRLFSGGHESAGAMSLASSWFFAEGATGDFFDTFVLLSNPESGAASVTMRYLLDSGETVTRTKTIPAESRLTVNVATEGDPRLNNAAVSTVVTSDRAVVAERSMYWKGDPGPWSEGHNSFGVTQAGLHWGLAEGRVGGPLDFRTYILLANPDPTAAEVTVTFLRETGPPIVRTYTVRPTSRFNIDVNTVAAEMQNESVGADVRVTNGVPIVVERSMYWSSGGVFFKGGTNATATRLP